MKKKKLSWTATIEFGLKSVSAFSKDTHRDICKYFEVYPVEEQIAICWRLFTLRYHASESDVCLAISKLI